MTTLGLVNADTCDLWYDATTVDAELGVETSISHARPMRHSTRNPVIGWWSAMTTSHPFELRSCAGAAIECGRNSTLL